MSNRLGKLEKRLKAGEDTVNLWGCLIPRAELAADDARTGIICQAARGLIPKAPAKRLAGVPRYEDLYPIPGYINTLIARAKKQRRKTSGKHKTV